MQQRGNLEGIDWATGRRRQGDARARCAAWQVTACGCLVLLGVVALGVLGPAARSAPAGPVLSVSRNAVLPGQQVRVVGLGFPARARVRLVLAGRSLGRLRVGRRGGFRLRVRIPRGLAAGRYRLAARSGGAVARVRLRVLARQRPSEPLPEREPSPPPPEPGSAPIASPPPPTPPEQVTLVAAGDIACRPELIETATACRQARTAGLVESLAPDAVAVLGDNQYEHGELANFLGVFEPTWGRFRQLTHPAVGNHEYEGDPERDQAPGYFSYFGAAAGDPAKGYYRWELGGWTLFALNTGAINWTRPTGGNPMLPDDCWPVSCAAGSEQEQWLHAELEALPDDACVIAYWHHPRFSSGFGGANQPHPETGPLFAHLYQHGVELLLTGHSHNYERLEPVTPEGIPDPGGVTQFVVGTGGRNLHIDTGPQLTVSEVLRTDVFGVLELTLEPGAYSARFVGEDGLTVDESSGTCHPPPASDG
jgi:Calcineurin-like phosphoesterase